MSVGQLTKNNFKYVGTQKKTLGINVNGSVLVCFETQDAENPNRLDPNCAEFKTIFMQFAKIENRVQCAICNLTYNPDVTKWSRTTSTPIQMVPVLILYMDGVPFSKVNGTKNVQSIQAFITKSFSTGHEMTQPMSHPQQGGYQYNNNEPQNMYGGPQQNKPSHFPEGLGKAPSLKGVIKNYKGGYMGGNETVDDEDDPRLLVPATVTPYNTPWEAEVKEF